MNVKGDPKNRRNVQLEIFLFVAVVVFCISCNLLWSGIVDYDNVSNRQVVSLSKLKDYVGKDSPVRVQVTATGDPPVNSKAGEKLAFEYVHITHHVGRLNYDDFQGWSPDEFSVSDGKNKVWVRPKGITFENLCFYGIDRVTSTKEMSKKLLDAIPQELCARFKIDPTSHHFVEVYTISKGDPLTIVATVGEENGSPVLKATPTAGLWISRLAPQAMQEKSFSQIVWSAGFLLASGIALIYGGRKMFFGQQQKQ